MGQKIRLFLNKNVLYLGLLTLLVVLAYVNSLNNEFISDDIYSIVDNPWIRNLQAVFSRPQAIGRHLPFFIIYKIWGLVPSPYRFVNILLHIGNVWLLFVLLTLLINRKTAFIASALFAVHPLLVESVAWISGGGYAQYTFFFLISFIFYYLFERHEKKQYYIFTLVFFLLSLVSNRNAIVLPLIFVTYDLSRERIKKQWKYYIPFFSMSLVWLYLFLGPLKDRVESLQTQLYQQPGLNNPLSQIPVALYSYLELILFPYALTFYHTELSFSAVKFLFAVVVVISYIVSLFVAYKKNKTYFFWLTVFVIPLLPTLTPLRISWVVAERYAYISILGIIVPLAIFFNKLYDKKKYKEVTAVILTILIMILTIRTIVRNNDWQDGDHLWPATAKFSPSSPWNHNNMGDLYIRHGNLEAAVTEFQRAIELLPRYAEAYHNLGNTYGEMGRSADALRSYESALQNNPTLWQTHVNSAAIYFKQEKYEQAQKHMQAAIQIMPNNAALYSNAGVIYLKMKDVKNARNYFVKALQLDPNNSQAKTGLAALQ